MIAGSKSIKVAALTLAAAFHIGLSNGFAPDVKVELESATGAAQAMVGASFADMSKGVMTAEPVEAVAEPIQPITALSDAPTPEHAPIAAPAEMAAKPEPRHTIQANIQPTKTERALTAIAPTPPVQSTSAAAQPSETQSAAPTTRVTAITPEQTAPTSSMRPTRRDPAKEIKVAAKPKSETRTKPKPQAKGNSNRNASKGTATGQQQAKAAVQGTPSGKATTSGNAAASNYPGKVMRRLARVNKVRGVGRGKAEVAFKIASNGGLAGASLRRSSGSGAFDKAAVRAVQRAAPFPPPPAGAQRSFKILITGS